jgi:hypothetical protein
MHNSDCSPQEITSWFYSAMRRNPDLLLAFDSEYSDKAHIGLASVYGLAIEFLLPPAKED